MKKIIALLLVLTLLLSLTGCDLSELMDSLPFGSSSQTVEDILKDAMVDTNDDQLSGDSPDKDSAQDAEDTPAQEEEQLPAEEELPAEDEPEELPAEDEPQDTPAVTPQFPPDKPYLSLYWDAICYFKTLVQFRLAEDWEHWSEQPALSATMAEALAAYDNEVLWDNMISELPAHFSETEDAFGYILYDLNGDDIPELFWVRQDFSIIAVFTVYKEKLCLLATSHSRLPIYISDNGTFYAWSTEGAAAAICELYYIKQGRLQRSYFFVSDSTDGTPVYWEGISGAQKFEISEYAYDVFCAQYPHDIGWFWQSFPIYPLSHIPEEFDGGGEKEPNTKYMPYLQKVKQGDFYLFAGPGFHYEHSYTIEEPGTFTIINEIRDAEGNLWGKLKSGQGWINLTVARS